MFSNRNPSDYTYIIWYEDDNKIDLFAVNNDNFDDVFAMTRYKPDYEVDDILDEQVQQITDFEVVA